MQQAAIFQTLADYNRWMNERLYARCGELPAAERERDRGAFFGSISGTLNHIMLADMLWLDRFYQVAPRRRFSTLDETVYADFAELSAARARLDAEISDWVATLDDAWLAQPVTFTSLVSPNPRSFRRGDALLHFFNHQTHHRGQVTTLLKQAGIEPGVTDLLWLPGLELQQPTTTG